DTAVPVGALALIVIVVAAAGFFYGRNVGFIRDLTTDPTGEETIALAQHTPPGAALMLAWGPRYFAVGFARDVIGYLPGVELVDHKADYRALLERGALVTPAYTFYNQSVDWWQEQVGSRVYLRAVAPLLVQIDTRPELESEPRDEEGIVE